MAGYIYQSIDLGKPATRFLRLSSGKFGDEIQCDLFQGRINQAEDGIPYEALSYTWGSTKNPAPIAINGSVMHVTLNLYAALQHLRFEYTDRILWVDAICIDQANIPEKNHQIQLMGHIYEEAECVIIWLGGGTEESDLIMDSMKRLQQNNVKVEGDWRHSHSAALWIPSQAGLGDKYLYEYAKLRKGMGLMLQRPWFQRIWILQEVANARVATIHCGKKSVSAQTFAQVPSILGLQLEPHSQAVLDIMPGFSRKESWWGDRRNLHTLLLKFRQSKATDERDMIYALLGISSDAYLTNISFADYKKPLQQVIRDTASFLLSHTDQDYNFLDWTLPEFLQSLDSLSSVVLGSASENGQAAIVKLLLSTNGIELDWKDTKGQTPLHRAAYHRHEAVVQLLLDKGANFDSEDKEGKTPLLRAIEKKDEAIVELLLDKGADFKTKDKEGKTPLYWASYTGYYTIVQLLLSLGADVNFAASSGWTPLHRASSKGYYDVVQLLLNWGANVNAMASSGWTPLYWASSNGHRDVVQLLLDCGADINAATSNGWTPLYRASRNGHHEVVQLLLDNGTDIESKDKDGRMPL